MIRGEYTALAATEIRLLRLSTDPGDAIAGQLETVALGDAPPYYALSHAWVSDKPPEVVVEGGLMHLGSNLSACIRRVRELSVRAHEDFPNVNYIKLRAYDERLHTASGLPGWDDVRWKYLRNLMNVRWFSRIWVVQEVVLSPRDPVILHGKCQYAWESLGWAVAWLRRSGYMRLPQIPEQLRNVDTISNLRRSDTRWPLDALMSITQIKFHATDQRDKVYGLLGLAAECHCQDDSAIPDELKPDYNIDVATLYNRVARFLFRRNSSLAILTRSRGLEGTQTRAQRQYDLSLPSWCPDWSDFTTYNMGIYTSLSWIDYAKSSSLVTFGFPSQYAASDGLKLDFEQGGQAEKDDSVLQIGGFTVDEVKHVQRVEISRHHHAETLGIDDLNTRMTLVLRLGLSLTSSSDIIPWAKEFIRSTTANQCRLNGATESQGFADGAAWLYTFLQNNRGITGLAAKNESWNTALSELRKASINGIPEHYVALSNSLHGFILRTPDQSMATRNIPSPNSTSKLVYSLTMGNYPETDIISDTIVCDKCAVAMVETWRTAHKETIVAALPLVSYSKNTDAWLQTINIATGSIIFTKIERLLSESSKVPNLHNALNWQATMIQSEVVLQSETFPHVCQLGVGLINEVILRNYRDCLLHDKFPLILSYPLDGFIVTNAALSNSKYSGILSQPKRRSVVLLRFLYHLLENCCAYEQENGPLQLHAAKTLILLMDDPSGPRSLFKWRSLRAFSFRFNSLQDLQKYLSNHAVMDRYRLSLTAADLLDTPLLTAIGLAAFRRLGPLFSWIEREAGNAIAVFVHYLMRLETGPCLPRVLFQRLREREELKEALADPGALSARAVERLIKPLAVLQ
ncbi:het-6-heterokaryon incompatibility [Fusarium mundagurra]|uniref:Het-6-heterokaryon incompatibility n=1 Tax=Fusarium mundagurra TaxID=1567541 RepID=A0A8H5Z4S3_9HYPO|nr:het-6-heterokaryon incompatibility [Fusarium mundagurra]